MRCPPAVLAIACFLGAAPALAHDFWLRPASFSSSADTPLKVELLIGHGREVEPWSLTWDRLHAFYSVGPTGLRDQQAGVVIAPGRQPSVTVALDEPGTHIVVMGSYQAHSELPGDAFNAYAELEGLTAAQEARRAAGTQGKPGRETYSRRAKALVQVGDRLSDTVTKPVGLTLEIVPERNPYAPSASDQLPVRVFFRGRPLAGALVDLTALDLGTEPSQPQRTDRQGRASFLIPRVGAWKINVIWTQPVTDRPNADFDTVFSSLTFGYPDAAAEPGTASQRATSATP